MLAKSKTCAIVGLDGVIVEVEVDISPGLPAFTIVGLPDAAVQEARERVRAAIRNSGCEFPMRRITVNLAPADLRKAGPAYDLPIAVSVLVSSGQLLELPDSSVFLGELSLDGSLRHTNAMLPMVVVARQEGCRTVFVPAPDAREAALVEGVEVVPVRHLAQLIAHLRREDSIEPYSPAAHDSADGRDAGRDKGPDLFGLVDLADIRGQEHAKRALEVAAAGGHNLLMSGPPGSGKTLLARAMPSILPRLGSEEALEVTKIYSVGGLLPSASPLISERPFRAPHYTISSAGLVGGGACAQAGRDHVEPSRRALSRRAPRVRTFRPGGAEAAARGQDRDHQQGPGYDNLSRQFHADRRHESVPVRVRLRPGPGSASARRRPRPGT